MAPPWRPDGDLRAMGRGRAATARQRLATSPERGLRIPDEHPSVPLEVLEYLRLAGGSGLPALHAEYVQQRAVSYG